MSFNRDFNQERGFEQHYVRNVQQDQSNVMTQYPITDLFTDNLDLCCLMTSNRDMERKIWDKVKDYNKILVTTEQNLNKEIVRMESGGVPPGKGGGGSGGNRGASGSGGDDNEGYINLLKAVWEMIKNIGLELKKTIEQNFSWEPIYHLITKCLIKFFPAMSKAISVIDRNRGLIQELLIKYFKEKKNISLKDIVNLILTNVKDGTFQPILDVYDGIKERSYSAVIIGSIKIALNIFSLYYGGFWIPILVELAKSGADTLINGVSYKNNDEFLKGFHLLIFEMCDKGGGRSKCTLL